MTPVRLSTVHVFAGFGVISVGFRRERGDQYVDGVAAVRVEKSFALGLLDCTGNDEAARQRGPGPRGARQAQYFTLPLAAGRVAGVHVSHLDQVIAGRQHAVYETLIAGLYGFGPCEHAGIDVELPTLAAFIHKRHKPILAECGLDVTADHAAGVAGQLTLGDCHVELLA